MKPPWDWIEADIQDLIINQRQESLELDYKACAALARTDPKKMELSKDVSAFANSSGGTIIYGVHEKDHVPMGIDVGYDQNDVSKEWLEQVINSGIQRRIDGIRINPVRLSSAPGRVLYVISIPQSMRAPHMASDKRFYKRFNFSSVPMEEYEVRDVGRRTEAPDLKIELRMVVPVMYPLVNIGIFITNMAPEPATHAMIRIFVDSSLSITLSEGLTAQEVVQTLMVNDAAKRMRILRTAWAMPPRLPIWEGEWLSVLDQPLQLQYPRGEDTRVIAWQITSPRMSLKMGFYGIAERPAGITFGPI